MNKYKRNRQEFFHRYFDYPSRLEIAIKKTEPVDCFEVNVSGAEVNSVRNVDSTKGIVRLLNKHGYLKHYFWIYRYRDMYRMLDWAALYWKKNNGLWIHFEWMQTYSDENGEMGCLEMNEPEWNFFYSKRRIIFANFYPSSLLKFSKDEDFIIQLTDNRLNKMIEWS
jgi:hypothetical protein